MPGSPDSADDAQPARAGVAQRVRGQLELALAADERLPAAGPWPSRPRRAARRSAARTSAAEARAVRGRLREQPQQQRGPAPGRQAADQLRRGSRSGGAMLGDHGSVVAPVNGGRPQSSS